MEDKKAYIKAEMEGGRVSIDIGGSPMKLGYLIAGAINSISEKSELPLPVLMGYIETAARKHKAKEKDEDKDCENCPEREKCKEMNDAMKLIRGRL